VQGKLKYIILLVIVILLGIHWDMMRIARTEDKQPTSEMIVATYDVDKIQVGPVVETLIIVQAEIEAVNTDGILFAYTRSKKEDGNWSLWKDEVIGMPVKLGKRGLGRRETGDGKTPTGFYNLNTPFGTKAPEEGFPENYVQLNDSMYWDRDENSATYNHLVDGNKVTGFRKEVSERLSEAVPDHSYCLNIDYNADGARGIGSSVFLQCFGRDGINTDGAVATDEETMKKILRLYKEDRTLILIDEKGSFSKYY